MYFLEKQLCIAISSNSKTF